MSLVLTLRCNLLHINEEMEAQRLLKVLSGSQGQEVAVSQDT